MTKYPRLHTDEPEPPAPLPFPGRDAGVATRDTPRHQAEDAIERAQAALRRLEELNDEAIAAFPFPNYDNDDDGPWAA